MSSFRQITPSKPSIVIFICFWNISGADKMPKGKQWKQLPNGVINIDDYLENSTYLNLEFASICWKVKQLNLANAWSTDKTICHFCFHVRSLGLGTTTILAHQSVGPSTLEMIFSCSILSSSSFTCAMECVQGKQCYVIWQFDVILSL